MILTGNAVIGQSGGPSAAINATLSGVVKAAMALCEIKEIYGAKHGIIGIMNEDFVNLREILTTEECFFNLECTPAAALGSCRYRLPPIAESEIYEKIFSVFTFIICPFVVFNTDFFGKRYKSLFKIDIFSS